MADPRDPAALLAAYDAQMRQWEPARLPAGVSRQIDGPVVRVLGVRPRPMVTHLSLAGLDEAELDTLIARQRDHYGERGCPVEWRMHGHDHPRLAARLEAAGFVATESATVVVGLAAPVAAADAPGPPGVRLREVTAREDLERVAELEVSVWGEELRPLGESLARHLAADPTTMTVVVAETVAPQGEPGPGEPGTVVSAGWVTYLPGTSFATLSGGTTRPGWRGRGIYRALATHRARLAVSRGYTHLQVEATESSRPMLERCGLVAVTTTTTYVHTPAPAAG